MNELGKDLKDSMSPDFVYVPSNRFRNETEREEYIKTHPARIRHIKANVVESDGSTVWKSDHRQAVR